MQKEKKIIALASTAKESVLLLADELLVFRFSDLFLVLSSSLSLDRTRYALSSLISDGYIINLPLPTSRTSRNHKLGSKTYAITTNGIICAYLLKGDYSLSPRSKYNLKKLSNTSLKKYEAISNKVYEAEAISFAKCTKGCEIDSAKLPWKNTYEVITKYENQPIIKRIKEYEIEKDVEQKEMQIVEGRKVIEKENSIKILLKSSNLSEDNIDLKNSIFNSVIVNTSDEPNATNIVDIFEYEINLAKKFYDMNYYLSKYSFNYLFSKDESENSNRMLTKKDRAKKKIRDEIKFTRTDYLKYKTVYNSKKFKMREGEAKDKYVRRIFGSLNEWLCKSIISNTKEMLSEKKKVIASDSKLDMLSFALENLSNFKSKNYDELAFNKEKYNPENVSLGRYYYSKSAILQKLTSKKMNKYLKEIKTSAIKGFYYNRGTLYIVYNFGDTVGKNFQPLNKSDIYNNVFYFFPKICGLTVVKAQVLILYHNNLKDCLKVLTEFVFDSPKSKFILNIHNMKNDIVSPFESILIPSVKEGAFGFENLMDNYEAINTMIMKEIVETNNERGDLAWKDKEGNYLISLIDCTAEAWSRFKRVVERGDIFENGEEIDICCWDFQKEVIEYYFKEFNGSNKVFNFKLVAKKKGDK